MTLAVEVKDLTIHRGGKEVLRGISFDVPPGEVTGLLGPSGCGKSTLMRAIVGVQHIDAGFVRVLGTHAGAAGLRSRIGYVTQDPAVYGDLSVVENLRFFADVLGVDRSKVDEVLETVDLGEQRSQVVERLSGGQRSRVSLAVALLNDPALVVLDEPTVGLDPVLRAQLWATFHRLADAGAAVFVSSHVMDEATRCHRLLMMRSGRIIADDSPAGLLEDTRTHDIETAFLTLVEGSEE